ncbi:MAG: hypothetical protein FJ011_10475 [Chloroflexi bacterium]|nr:hypothetical protein [Chloroflexota bacterium]
MKQDRGYFALGLLLVALGVVFLLQNFGLLSGIANLVWVTLFGLGGLAFLWVFITNNEQWWALIPGFTLLGLAGLIGFGGRLGEWGAALFLAAIGLSFWLIYAVRRDFWWAIIPGGALFSVALLVALSDVMKGEAAVGVFFLGLAATFGLVSQVSTPEGKMKWALIPAAVLAIMGFLFLLTLGGLMNYVWAVALILGGAFLILRTLARR